MKQLMEYKIISGRVHETRRVLMPCRSGAQLPKRRGVRVKGKSSLSKILANEQEAVKRLARIINCNFGPGDLWLTLKYDDDRLPEYRAAAELCVTNLLRRVKRWYKKETGDALRYVLVTSDNSPRSGEKARLHHHLVMDRVAWEYIIRQWPADQISYSLLDARRDYTGIARYMVGNAPKGDNKHRWSCSTGLAKPVYTEPVPVDSVDGIKIPKGANIRENITLQDEETGVRSAYCRYIVAPKR